MAGLFPALLNKEISYANIVAGYSVYIVVEEFFCANKITLEAHTLAAA